MTFWLIVWGIWLASGVAGVWLLVKGLIALGLIALVVFGYISLFFVACLLNSWRYGSML